MSIVVIAGIFGAIYNPSTGLLNTFLRAIGLDPLAHQWMGDQNIVLYSIIFALVWQAIGYYMVMYMASMAAIPEDLYEAASLDGATEIQMFFQVTLPLIWSNIRTTLTFYIISTINLSLPVRTDHVRRRPQRPLGSIPELYVQAGIWRRRIWLWYGHWRSGISFLVCTCGSCQ